MTDHLRLLVTTLLVCLALSAALILPPSLLSAQDEESPPEKAGDGAPGEMREVAEAFLAEARKKYELHSLNGLESFGIEIRVFSEGQDRAGERGNRGRRGRNGLVPPSGGMGTAAAPAGETVTYEWEAPDTEEIVADNLPGQLRKSVQSTLRGIWRDIACGSVFPGLEGEGIVLEGTDEGMVVTVASDNGTTRKVLFDTETMLALREERSRDNGTVVIIPSYTLAEGRLRFQRKIVTISGKGGKEGKGKEGKGKEGSYSYGGFRKISGFTLPTSLSVNFGSSEGRFTFIYTHINGQAAEDAGIDPDLLKKKIKEFEKQYSKWSSPEKIAAMKELSTMIHDSVATSIAKKGLRDKDLNIRKETAGILGRMGCRNVVPALAKAMKSNEKNLTVHLAIIDALGRIGDPKAIPYVSKDFWGSKERTTGMRTGRAKIGALGRIESKKSVEALIDLLYKFGHGKHGSMGALLGDVTQSLKKLTGQDFGRDREKWKKWWKQNRSKLKLKEDR